MNLTRVNIVLGVLLAVTTALTFAMNPDYSIPNVEFLPEMKRSPALGAYDANSVFPNGRTLQPPVRGTIARGVLPLYYEPTKEDAERAGAELQNPFAMENISDMPPVAPDDQPPDGDEREAPTAGEQQTPPEEQHKTDARARLNASIQRGAQIYNVFCISCHGPSGAGDGPVAKRGFPPPPSLTTGKSVQMKDGRLFHILTYGQGSMAPMSAQLSRERRWHVINYVRSLKQAAKQNQTQPASETDDASPDVQPTKPSQTKEGK